MLDFSNAKEMGNYTLLPEGNYTAMIGNVQWASSKGDQDNRYLMVEFLIRDKVEDAIIREYLNLYNKNEMAVEIAFSKTKAILTALGKSLKVENDQQLVQVLKGKIKILIRHEERTRDGKTFKRMAIKKFEKAENSDDFMTDSRHDMPTVDDIPF